MPVPLPIEEPAPAACRLTVAAAVGAFLQRRPAELDG